MATYLATVTWERNDQTFTDNQYSRGHRWRFDGGLEVPASSSLTLLLPTLVFLLSLAICPAGNAQQVDNVDEAFDRARELAFEGEREEARNLARAILEIAPDYHDVRILIARTYSWDQRYAEARKELAVVFDKDPRYRDALSAAIDNERWSEHPGRAVELAMRATRFYPSDELLLVKRAEAHYAAGQEKEALRVLNFVERTNPSNESARELRRNIRVSGQNYTLSASYMYDHFSDVFDPWKSSYIQLSRKTPIGSIIGRINYSDRFGITGFQPEIDIYPEIADGLYGYLNAGYTKNSLYSDLRLGAELYKRLSDDFETSLGFRYMKFETRRISIYTGSVAAYVRNWYISVRPYLTPSSGGLSSSLFVRIRNYFNGPENYITLRSGFGFSPEERRFQNVSGDVFLVHSQFIGIRLFKAIRYNLAFFGAVDLGRQDLAFDPGRYIQVYTFNIGTQIKF